MFHLFCLGKATSSSNPSSPAPDSAPRYSYAVNLHAKTILLLCDDLMREKATIIAIFSNEETEVEEVK